MNCQQLLLSEVEADVNYCNGINKTNMIVKPSLSSRAQLLELNLTMEREAAVS